MLPLITPPPFPLSAVRRLIAIAVVVTSPALAAEKSAPDPGSGSNVMHHFLQREARRLDDTFLDGITNRGSWESRRSRMHQEYLEMLGLWPMPERTPLKAQITGTVIRQEGFRVENLHFQSRPGLYVTGNLYLPKYAKAGDKLPAVLYVCGHSGRGRDGNKAAFQHHGMWFATHGYACLIIDTLQLGEIAAIHHGTYRHNRWWWQARGYTSAAVECWNGVRALDYLQSRPEVDGERLAVTGISGGGAATFWIAAADERVKVAVPVSGMSDLEDYVGAKVVNGHCDCMFLINTFQWPWTQIAALVAPRPLLFANSGHDTIFPMDGNDRIRARLERLYGFYTNRTDRLFDIAVTPGGHEDNPELRLMAYRWINHHLKGDDSNVTEPELPRIEDRQLRAFPDQLPADELNTKIDEVFVPLATNTLPQSRSTLSSWREAKLAELRRLSFRSVPENPPSEPRLKINPRRLSEGTVTSEPGVQVPWKHHPAEGRSSSRLPWVVMLGEEDALDSRPDWARKAIGDEPMLLVAPRGLGALRFPDPAPFYVQRSLPLLGRTVDTCRLIDFLAVLRQAAPATRGDGPSLKVLGRGASGVIAAYAALLDSDVTEIALVDPPSSHREGPTFLNVLRVLDTPAALGLLAPRSLTIHTSQAPAFETTRKLYELGGGAFNLRPLP